MSALEKQNKKLFVICALNKFSIIYLGIQLMYSMGTPLGCAVTLFLSGLNGSHLDYLYQLCLFLFVLMNNSCSFYCFLTGRDPWELSTKGGGKGLTIKYMKSTTGLHQQLWLKRKDLYFLYLKKLLF